MTFSQRDIVLKQRERDQAFEPRQVMVPAKIIAVNGSTIPPNEPEKVWVQRDGVDLDQGKAINRTTLTEEGTPVLLGYSRRNPHQWVVLGTYSEEANPVTATNGMRFGVSKHAANHQYPSEASPGPDAIMVYQPALAMLKMSGDGASLTVDVLPLSYIYDGVAQIFEGGDYDLTSSVPGSGLTRRVLVYLDVVSNNLAIVEGTTVSSSGALPVPYPDIPRLAIAIGYVQLTNGQTTITTATHITDARSLLQHRPDYVIPLRWSWADSTARGTETDVTQSDVDNYRLGLQVDTGVLYRATATTPTWVAVGGGTLVTETAQGFSIISGSTDVAHFSVEQYPGYSGSDYAVKITPYDDSANSIIEAGNQYYNSLTWKAAVDISDVTIAGNGNSLTLDGNTTIDQDLDQNAQPTFSGLTSRNLLVPNISAGNTLSRGGLVSLSNNTTDNTPTELFVVVGTSTRFSIPADSAVSFLGLLTARRSDADNESHSWLVHGGIDNNGGTTALFTSISSLANDGDTTWTLAVTADDTNDALIFTVTGENSKDIDWNLFLLYSLVTE